METRLNGLRSYLSGPCENAKFYGAGWRDELTPKLKELGLIVFDPVHKNGAKLDFIDNNSEEFNYVKDLRNQGKFEELAKCMRSVVHLDLRLIDCCDLVIVQLDESVATTGTIDEICLACLERKPVFLCSKQGKKSVPIWLFGRIPLEYIFNDLDEILQRLKDIAYCDEKDLPKYIDNKRWLFSNKLGV